MPIVFEVYVRPRSSAASDADEWFDGLPVVRVTASPVDGEANRTVLAAVADRLMTRRSALGIVSGHRSRRKRLSLDDDRPEVLSELQQWLRGGPSRRPAG